MSLLSRVISLENMAKPPAMPVYVVFQQVGESDEKVKSRIKSQNFAIEDIVILVNFIET